MKIHPTLNFFDMTFGDCNFFNQHPSLMSGFKVTPTGACDGYQWEVAWETKGGDRPLMQASGEDLRGLEAQINIENVIDGGVWLRPLRGDMLRLPEYEPQASIEL